MKPVELKAFELSVARRGIEVPIEITTAGVILDGHHRHRAALSVGLDSVPVRVVNPADELDYMYSAAIHRRQLEKSQRAALALRHGGYLAAKEAAAARKTSTLRNVADVVADLPQRGRRSREIAADLAGVSERLVQDVIKVQNKAPALFEQVVAGELPANRALQQIQREERYAQIGPAGPLPEGSFDLIYADPPWQLGSPSSDRSPEQHYPTLPTSEIAQLAIPAADDAILFLWAVTSLLPDAFELIDAWGFTYKTALVWRKPSIGLGNYARSLHEELLIATHGKYGPPPPWRRPDSVIEAPRGRHSAKPERFRELIEDMYPNAQRLELFARGRARPGWTAWGNEAES